MTDALETGILAKLGCIALFGPVTLCMFPGRDDQNLKRQAGYWSVCQVPTREEAGKKRSTVQSNQEARFAPSSLTSRDLQTWT